MPSLILFGLGYSARFIAGRLEARGWHVTGTSRDGRQGTVAFDQAGPALAAADYVLSSVPPDGDMDPVLARYGDALGGKSLSYLSSTAVYGDAGGAWVDESSPLGGIRASRTAADAAWLERGARVFRLPGIYGLGRSALDRVAEGRAHRVDVPGQVFSRIHVEDLADGVVAGIDAPAGAYNLADDMPASQNEVVAFAAHLLGLEPPPFVALESLSPMARSFYAGNRRVANLKAKRLLGWQPRFSDYRLGLRALRATTSPAMASAAPSAASSVQR